MSRVIMSHVVPSPVERMRAIKPHCAADAVAFMQLARAEKELVVTRARASKGCHTKERDKGLEHKAKLFVVALADLDPRREHLRHFAVRTMIALHQQL
jgi:hypothetical protein